MSNNSHKQWFLDRMRPPNKNLTAVAKELGMHKSALSRALDGKREVKAVEAGRIATLLGATQEEVTTHLQGIAAASRGKEAISNRVVKQQRDLPTNPLSGFAEEPQKEIKPSTRPRHPGFGFMKGQIKFAEGFDGTGPYDDEPWDQGYLGEDQLDGR